MADTLYKIVFDGQLRTGVDLQTAKLNLAQLFKSETSAVEKLFSGKPIALKRGLTHSDALSYISALTNAGVEARIETDPAISLSLEEIEEPRAYAEPASAYAASPYAPPRAPVGAATLQYSTLKVFSVQGRIGRVRYLAWSLVLMVAALLVAGLCAGVMSVSLIGGGLLATVAFVAFLVISVQIGVQRLHDVGWSGWLLLLNLIPFVNSIFPILIIVMPGNQGANQYGPPAPPNSQSVKVLAWLWVAFLALIITAGIVGGFSAIQAELENSTVEYEQSLPYDDDAATPSDEDSDTVIESEVNK
ncbi:DUF805 domain-containing protein [Pseudomonas syringae]|uniref:Membrane protein n=1 Tax=Pseudomonas syringae TaxID=317 RepID=A0A085V7L6_PSESX|nr:DUF805 domain-containing protein [Pseudomonas syringae]KFE51429.1 membrane protein [Pseudomonas syringae]